MRHLLFLSYANKDADDTQFKGFFGELCEAIAAGTPWSKGDDEIAFRDRDCLRLGERWEPKLRQALEASSVLVCLASPKYFGRAFCGKEFFVFQQRIEKYAADERYSPPVILPVIWVPSETKGPVDAYVWQDASLPDDYERLGLRGLRFEKRAQYNKALAAIARSIIKTWKAREYETERPSGVVQEFEQIPNAFGGDDWGEAADGTSWISGPTVANVVYGAGTARVIPSHKYGETAREWKPFLPPHAETVGALTRSAVHRQSLKYREIPVDDNLETELRNAQNRKNLILVVADATSLDHQPNPKLKAYDPLRPEGTALLMPWDASQEHTWESSELKQHIDDIFPVKSRTPECFRAPILSVEQLSNTLDATLVEIRANLTKQQTNNKPIIDGAPATVSGAQ